MKRFELMIDNIVYECAGNQSDAVKQNWQIRATIQDFKVTIDIPIERELSRAKAMLFIENFHVAFQKTKSEQKL